MEEVKQSLQLFAGKEVLISITGVISFECIYDGFKYFMNTNLFLLCDRLGSEINIEMESIENLVADETKILIQLENDQKVLLKI